MQVALGARGGGWGAVDEKCVWLQPIGSDCALDLYEMESAGVFVRLCVVRSAVKL